MPESVDKSTLDPLGEKGAQLQSADEKNPNPNYCVA